MLPPLSLALGTHADTANLPERLARLAKLGGHRIMLDARHLKNVIAHPEYRTALVRGAKENHLEISDVHAPHEMEHSLGSTAPGTETQVLESGLAAIRTAAELGARTVTFHTGRTRLAGDYAPASGPIPCADVPSAVKRIEKQLDVLLKEAEKCKIILALENLFLPSSSAKVITEIVDRYQHSLLGLCYDSGHALLLENFPGKESSMIAEWIRCGWDDDTVIFQSDQLDTMLKHVVTAHLHDNNGCNDQHLFPGEGRADWPHILERLSQAPRLVSLQNEVMSKYFEEDFSRQTEIFRAKGFVI